MKTSFVSDNIWPACAEINEHLNGIEGQYLPYGEDEYCERGAARVRNAFGLGEEAAIHFVPNGTTANTLGCLAMLETPADGIISPDDGHLLIHEEYSVKHIGRSVTAAATTNSKLTLEAIDRAIAGCEAGITPRALYLSQATDRGLAYTKSELASIVGFAKEKGLYSFVDGARLGPALAREGGDLTLPEFGSLGLDMFWIGGTKNGGRYGEAMVVLNDELEQRIRNENLIKSMGALMSKSWEMGAQYERFFALEDDGQLLWLRLAGHANAQAKTIREGLRELNVELHFEGDGTGTNMLFPVLPRNVLAQLQEDYHFTVPFGKVEDETKGRVRIICASGTTPAMASGFVEKVHQYL